MSNLENGMKTLAAIIVVFIAALIVSMHADRAHARTSENSQPNIVFILDGSGSMWGKVEGQHKISIAKKVLTELIKELPDDSNVVLMVYGHRDKSDCQDIETIMTPDPLNKEFMAEKIEAVSPKGMTPITESVTQAFELVRSGREPATVILLTDGLETCGGDPCAAVKAAKDSGAELVMHVIGFDVAKEDVSQLECSAQAGGGLFLAAENAAGLASALNQAVELPPDAETGRLSVKVTAEGGLRDSVVKVTDTRTGEEQSARTYEAAETNPRIIPLPDGVYDVVVTPVGTKGGKAQTLTGVVIKEGETVEKTVDFSYGELSVKVTSGGGLSDATVFVYDAGTTNNVGGGRTYAADKSNPIMVNLTPGVYDVKVESVELADKPAKTFTGVEIKSGEKLEETVDFPAGTLSVGSVSGDVLLDATVSVKKSTGEAVASGRTYEKPATNPREYLLSPGEYTVSVKAIKSNSGLAQDFEVEIKEGERAEIKADFSE